MAQKKNETMTAINFRCSIELKRKLEVLQFATQAESISELIIRLCENAIEANSELISAIESARQSFPFKFPTAGSKIDAGAEIADVGVDTNAQN